MHKVVISSLLGVLLVCGTDVSGQFFKDAQRASKNLANLQQALKSKVQREVVNGPVLTGLSSATLEKYRTSALKLSLPHPITSSEILNKVFEKNPSLAYASPRTLPILLSIEWRNRTGNRRFYWDQSHLAKDLDLFYGGNSPVFVGPDGRKVKLYTLPVNGIWYKPIGYSTPVVLNADDYFVIYDIESQTGKIADNKPEIHKLFKSRTYDEIWEAMRAEKIFDDLGNLCNTVLMAHLHKARLDHQGVWVDVKEDVKQNQSAVWTQLNTQETLLKYMQQWPQVRQTTSGFKAYVVELPVKGLAWIDQNGDPHVYNPQDYEMLFFEFGALGIYPRSDVENPKFFRKIK